MFDIWECEAIKDDAATLTLDQTSIFQLFRWSCEDDCMSNFNRSKIKLSSQNNETTNACSRFVHCNFILFLGGKISFPKCTGYRWP